MVKIEETILAISFSFPHKVEQGRASYMQRSSFHSTTVRRGRRNKIPYVPFEALKARDLRLEPVPHLRLSSIPPHSMVRKRKISRALRTTPIVVSRNLLSSKCLLRLSPFPCTPWLEEVNKVKRCEKNTQDSIRVVVASVLDANYRLRK